jgi:hypothetical protein
MMKYFAKLLVVILLCSMFAGCAEYSKGMIYQKKEDGTVKSFPTEDQITVLHNPDMGWVLYDNFIISKNESPAYINCPTYGYKFPGVDTVMLKFTWADIEKSEGAYDFSGYDFIYDYWKHLGKDVTCGMSTDSLLWYGLSGTGVPGYVLGKMPQEKVKTRDYIDNSSLKYKVCDASDPYYMQRLVAFLTACEDHFQKTNRPMRYIDLRGYGLWGEWHQGYQYESIEAKRKALDGVLKAWSEAFPKSWLALSYSYDPDEPQVNYTDPNKITKYLEWSAFDLATKYSNITLRRDGAGGAVQSNERIFCADIFKTVVRGPFTSEGVGGYTDKSSAENILNDGLTLHPNYFTIIGWANEQAKSFIEQEPDLFNYGLMTMGYRFVPNFVEYNGEVQNGSELKVTSQWLNRAVGKAARDYELKAVLTDAKGNKKYEFSLGATGSEKWIQNKKYDVINKATVPSEIKAGEYNFCLAMYDKVTKRYINLAIKNKEPQQGQYYVIGPIKIK